MGTFYDVRGALELDAEGLEGWLAERVGPCEPWGTSTVRELITVLADGVAPINGHLVGALPIRIDGGRVRWSWRRIPSEVSPEILRVSRALWRAGARFATGGVHTHGDALDGRVDTALLALDGAITDVTRLLPMIGELMVDDPEGITPGVDCADIPF